MVLRVVLIVLAVAVLGALLYVGGRWLEESRYQGEDVRGDLSQRVVNVPTITYEGETYAYRKNLLTILFMGVDRESEEAVQTGSFRNGGQADFLMLAIIDPDSKTVSRIPIDRDTMAEITVLGVFGNVTGTRSAQISLSHGFGDGREQSCLLTVEAVERLLYGVDVDFYVAINLEGIAALNDAVGGVSVPIEDDFSAVDAAMRLGETMKLDGRQAELYVRSRMSIGDGSNTSRMRRQSVYLTALLDTIEREAKSNANKIGDIYDTMGSSLITDMKRGRMINEAYKAASYAKGAPYTIAGEHMVSEDGFMEFHADADQLAQLVVDLFFQKVD